MAKTASMFETIFGATGDDDDGQAEPNDALNHQVHEDAAERRDGLLGRLFPSPAPASKDDGTE